MGGVAVAAAIGAAVGGGAALISGGDAGDVLNGALIGGAGGAVTGGLGSAFAPAGTTAASGTVFGGTMAGVGEALGSVGAGALAGVGGGLTSGLLSGSDNLLMSAGMGAIGGGVSGYFNPYTSSLTAAGNGNYTASDVEWANNLNADPNAVLTPSADGNSLSFNGQTLTNGQYNALVAVNNGIANTAGGTLGAGTAMMGSANRVTNLGGSGIGTGAAGVAETAGAGLGGWGTAALLGGGSIITGLLGAQAAQDAAQIQSDAAKSAANSQIYQYQQTRADLLPYQAVGLNAANALTSAMGLQAGGDPSKSLLLSTFNPTMAQLEATPGYKFNLKQGLDAAQNNLTAQGLGRSGAAAKGAINYAEGLASTTYQQQFQNALAQKQQIYNMLAGNVQSGQNAATQTGNFGMNATQAAGGMQLSGAAAQAAGQVGTAQAYGNALTGVGNAFLMNQMMNMYGAR